MGVELSNNAAESPRESAFPSVTAVTQDDHVLATPLLVSALLDALRALVVVTDTEARIVRFNSACETISGWTFDDMRGKTLSETPLSPEDVEIAQRMIRELNGGQRTAQAESCWRCRDGTRRLIAWSSSALRESNGNVRYVVRTGVDITEQRRMEDELNFSLYRSRRLLIAGELAATLAHEISQPLAAITGYSEACLQQMEHRFLRRDKLRQHIEQMSAQAQRAGTVIHEMRSFLKNGDLPRKPIDVNALILTACEQISERARWHEIVFELHLMDALPAAMSTPTHVERVMVNLLRNAVDAIRDSGLSNGWIRITTNVVDGEMVRVTLRDSGPGLDAKTAERVFEPFYTTKAEGLGVGLALSRSLVESHGGELWVDTDAVFGTAFHFTLPVAQ